MKWSFRAVGKTACLENFFAAAGISLSFKEKTGESMTQKITLNGLGRNGRMVLHSAFGGVARHIFAKGV